MEMDLKKQNHVLISVSFILTIIAMVMTAYAIICLDGTELNPIPMHFIILLNVFYFILLTTLSIRTTDNKELGYLRIAMLIFFGSKVFDVLWDFLSLLFFMIP